MVILKDTGDPEQVLEKGTTVIWAAIGTVELLLAVKATILPTPLLANPIDELLLVQLNTVPAIGDPVKLMALVVLIPQTTTSAT
jgi:hypothetical protein